MRNKVTISFLIIISIISLNKAQECKKVECKDIYKQNACVYSSTEEIGFQTCGRNKTCNFDFNNPEQAECVDTKPEIKKYPGMSCSAPEECINNQCQNGACLALQEGENCTSAFECDYGLTCTNKICVKPSPVGGSCQVDFDCDLNGACKDGVCVKYFSLPDGDQTGYINVHSGGLSLCQSGYASEFGECQTLKLKNKYQPCDENNECIYIYGKEEIIEPTNCLCGFNADQKKYCKLGSGDYKYKDYIKNLKEYYSSDLKQCHNTERGEGICTKDILAPSTDEKFVELMNKLEKSKVDALYYSQIYGADTCVKQILYPDIYKNQVIETCGKYKCTEEKTKYCAVSEYDEENLNITLKDICKEDEVCDIEGEPNNFFYLKRKRLSKCISKGSLFDKYPGEPCATDSDCKIIHSSNPSFGQCVNFTCFGYDENEQCSSSLECLAGLFCDAGKCIPQKQLNETCEKNEECQNHLLCYFTTPESPNNMEKTCQDVAYSLENGMSVYGLENQDVFCRYGIALDGKCVEIKDSSSTVGFVECEPGNDCIYEASTGDTVTRKCQCGFNKEGKGYCPRMHNYMPDQWLRLFQLKKESYDNKCHTLNRFQCKTDLEKEIQNLKINLIDAHLYVNAVDCAKKVLGNYDFTVNSNGFIRTSLLCVIWFAFVLI